MRLPAVLAALLLAACGEPTDEACRCTPGASCTAAGECVPHVTKQLVRCSSCKWALDVCMAQARDETLADIRGDACGLIVCFVWLEQRRAACRESFDRCAASCG